MTQSNRLIDTKAFDPTASGNRAMPVMALVFHEVGGSVFHAGNRGGGVLMSAHQVASEGNKAIMRPGRPLTEADRTRLLNALQGNGDEGLVFHDPHLIASGSGLTVWHRPSAKRPMHIRDHRGAQVLKVRWPHLLFCATDTDLYVAALGKRERPTGESELYRAPLGNIYHDGKVCLGGAKRPATQGEAAIPAWDEVLFGTAFSHQNDGSPVRSGVEPNDFWRERHQKGRGIQRNQLVPMNSTLARWLRHIQERSE